MKIRLYTTAELDAVIQVFTDAVHVLTTHEYDEAQRAAWAPRPPDISTWHERMQQLQTWVAIDDNRVTGFISCEMNGHIDLLYVSPLYARRGIASAMYQCAETNLALSGVTTLFTEASLVARPFFERFNSIVMQEQEVSRRGASFRRFIMRKRLATTQQAAAVNRPSVSQPCCN